MGKKSSSSTTASGLFGTLRNSFRKRSSIAKRNSVASISDAYHEAFSITSSYSNNDKVQQESNYSSKDVGINEKCSTENHIEINYANSNASMPLEMEKLDTKVGHETNCNPRIWGDIELQVTTSIRDCSRKDSQLRLVSNVGTPDPLIGKAETYLKMSDEDAANADILRFISNDIYANFAILSEQQMSQQNSTTSAVSNEPIYSSLPKELRQFINDSSSQSSTEFPIVIDESTDNNVSQKMSCTPPPSPFSSISHSLSSPNCEMSTSTLSINDCSSESNQSSLFGVTGIYSIKQHLQSKFPQYFILNEFDQVICQITPIFRVLFSQYFCYPLDPFTFT